MCSVYVSDQPQKGAVKWFILHINWFKRMLIKNLFDCYLHTGRTHQIRATGPYWTS